LWRCQFHLCKKEKIQKKSKKAALWMHMSKKAALWMHMSKKAALHIPEKEKKNLLQSSIS
jgi:hypothetical protein